MLTRVSVFLFIFIAFIPGSVNAWNATGHRIIAQIAYTNMSLTARRICMRYNKALKDHYYAKNLINAAEWLDDLRYKGVTTFNTFHYIDLPFTTDKTIVSRPNYMNAARAIEQAYRIVMDKTATDAEKGIAIRILLHVIGDIHQPLHAITRFSAEFPQGDRGGNLVILSNNAVAYNLHAYWDRGAGFLVGKKNKIQKIANRLGNNHPCLHDYSEVAPYKWANDSYYIAKKYVYMSNIYSNVPINYQTTAKKITQERLALAGCRLAHLLNRVN